MPRSITVLYFAAVREATGTGEERVELPDGVASIAALPRFLEALHPALSGRLESVRYAVNESFATATTELAAGDVVAVIPPVSGG